MLLSLLPFWGMAPSGPVSSLLLNRCAENKDTVVSVIETTSNERNKRVSLLLPIVVVIVDTWPTREGLFTPNADQTALGAFLWQTQIARGISTAGCCNLETNGSLSHPFES